MGGKTSRNKGARAEREFFALLQPVIDRVYECHNERVIDAVDYDTRKLETLDPPQLKRNLAQYQEGGADGVFPGWLSIEVKRCEALSVAKWWQQAQQAAGALTPVLAYRQSRQPWRVVMFAQIGGWGAGAGTFLLDDWLGWFERALEARLRNNYESL